MIPDYLNKPVLLHICRDGTVTYRTYQQKIFNGVALPFYSVDTEEEAVQLIVSLCSRQYTPHPKQPDRPWYVLPNFGGELEDIYKAADKFHARDQERKANRSCFMCGKEKRRRFYSVEGKRVCGHCVGRRLGGRPT